MEKTYADKKWDILSYLVIGFLLLLLAGRWPLLPNFIDIYYHIVTAQGFAQAGGYVTHDFWSFAPGGRAHLYPPFFHLVLAPLVQLGVPALTLARLADVAIFPLFLLVIFFFMRALFSSRLAFFCVLLSASLYSFYLASSNFIPATLGFIFGIASLWAQEKDRKLAAAVFLGLCFYAHAQVPWFFVVTYVIYGFLRRERLWRCAVVAVGGLAIAAPMLLYLFGNRAFYVPGARYENFSLEFNLYVLLAWFGVRRAFREKKAYALLGSLALAVVPFIASYPYRYLCGQGLLGLVLLAAVGLEQSYDAAQKHLGARGVPGTSALLAFVLVFTFISPAIIAQRGRPRAFVWLNSTYANLINWQQVKRPNDFSVSDSRYMRKLVDIVRGASSDKDIICSNLPFAGTVISALAQRADAQGMLAEVRSGAAQDPFSAARLVIWFKDQPAAGGKTLPQVVSDYSLEQVADTDIAFIVRTNGTRPQEQVRRADIPYAVIIVAAACLFFAAAWDLSR